MKLGLGSLVLVGSLLLACPRARADGVPVDAIDCYSKKVGDACVGTATGGNGVCKNDTCTTAKFDAAPSSYACLKCVPGDAPDDGSCSFAKQRTVRRFGPWFLAGLFSMLFLRGRRRPRS